MAASIKDLMLMRSPLHSPLQGNGGIEPAAWQTCNASGQSAQGRQDNSGCVSVIGECWSADGARDSHHNDNS